MVVGVEPQDEADISGEKVHLVLCVRCGLFVGILHGTYRKSRCITEGCENIHLVERI